jgi:son of sevenless-like protein
MSAEGNFKEYRAALHSVNPPLIPYMGVYLKDLTFIGKNNNSNKPFGS